MLKQDIQSLIDQIAPSKGVNPAIISAIVQHESGYQVGAQNPNSSAAGLMQLVNSAQKTYGVTNPFDPVQNLTAGTQFIADMLRRYNGDQTLALMAYAWGPGNVDNYLKTGVVPEGQQANFDMSKNFATYVNALSGGSGNATPSSSTFSDVVTSAEDFVSSGVDTIDTSMVDPTSNVIWGVVGIGLAYLVYSSMR